MGSYQVLCHPSEEHGAGGPDECQQRTCELEDWMGQDDSLLRAVLNSTGQCSAALQALFQFAPVQLPLPTAV